VESHSRVIRTANAVTAVESRSDWVDSFAPANGRNVAGESAKGGSKSQPLKERSPKHLVSVRFRMES